MTIVEVSDRKELFKKQLIFSIKGISLKDREVVYRFPDGREMVASVKMFERFRNLQRLLWIYCFPMVFIHEISHLVVDYLLDPYGPSQRVTKKKKFKLFLVLFAGPLSEIIFCLIGILFNLCIPLRIYLITGSVIPLIIWTNEDFHGILMVTGLWNPLIIYYGFSRSRGDWYVEVFDRYRKQRIRRRYSSNEQGIIKKVESLKTRFDANLVERKDSD